MSEKHTITGKVETCLPLETYPSGFTKRVLVVNTGGEYPQIVPIEFVKDKTGLLTGLRKGQEVTAHINIRGNEHNGKYYASIQGWKLEADGQERKAAPEPQRRAANPPAPAEMQDDEDDEEIPF